MFKSLNELTVLAVSPIRLYSGFNTSVHRIHALQSLGCFVEVIDSSLIDSNLICRLNRKVRNRLFNVGFPMPLSGGHLVRSELIDRSGQKAWDLIWLEKALDIDRGTIDAVKNLLPSTLIVGFSPDDMDARHNQSQQFLDSVSLYDYFLTTKSYNVSELQKLGCPYPIFIPNGYDPETFRPSKPSPFETASLGGDIGFIGTYEEDRANLLAYLAANKLRVRVWGNGWRKLRRSCLNLLVENRPLNGPSFSKACNAFKINLNFLRKCNRDQQTTRSIEIPASGGFMLAERSDEHQQLFKEGSEADFFSSSEELLDKCNYYLNNDSIRSRIAMAGYERCLRSGYSNSERIRKVLHVIASDK